MEFQIHQVDTRTDQEKTDDLIQEYLAQLELSSANDPCKEIEEKLNSLRGEGNKTVSRQKCTNLKYTFITIDRAFCRVLVKVRKRLMMMKRQ